MRQETLLDSRWPRLVISSLVPNLPDAVAGAASAAKNLAGLFAGTLDGNRHGRYSLLKLSLFINYLYFIAAGLPPDAVRTI